MIATTAPDKPATRIYQGGFSLIEVLVALLVLSIGLLGLAFLQITGMRYNSDSYMRTQATMLAYDIMDRMRVNKGAADAGAYLYAAAAPPASSTCGDTGGCTTKEALAAYDLSKWFTLQSGALPTSSTISSITRAAITTTSGANVWQYTITVRWNERDLAMSQVWRVEI